MLCIWVICIFLLIVWYSSGAVTKTAVAPLERVKILMQLSGMSTAIKALPTERSLYGVLVHIVSTEGALALFKGNMANVVRVVPVYALKFAFNDKFRNLVRNPGQLNRDLSTHQLMLAGTMAGLSQIVITYPLEVVRTRLSLSTASLDGQYTGIWHCFRTTVRTEGISALYKGLSATIWSGAPYVGLQMTSYELVKRYLQLIPFFVEPSPRLDSHDHQHVLLDSTKTSTHTSPINMIGKLTAGGLSGLISQTVTYPGDTIRRRMQTNGLNGTPRLYKNTWDCIIQIWQKEGIKAFMRGATTNVWRCIPGAAIQFAVYDSIKHLLGIAVE